MDEETHRYYLEHKLGEKIACRSKRTGVEDKLITVWKRMENLLGHKIGISEAEVWLHKMCGDDAFINVRRIR